jgi:MFS family permease
MNYNPRRLFVVSCLALITSAFSFQMRQNVADDVGNYFSLTREMVGALMGGQFLGMATAMLIFSPVCDALGMGKVLAVAWLCHLFGISGTIFADEVSGQAFVATVSNGLSGCSTWMSDTLHFSLLPKVAGANVKFWELWAAAFVIGSGNGLVEVAINPLAATIYPDQKTHKLNVLHAWWPGGLILAGLIALFLVNPMFAHEEKKAEFFGYNIAPASLGGFGTWLAALPSWKVKYGIIYIPLLLYGLLSVGQRFPASERVQASVSTGSMILQLLRPLFIIWAFCMVLTASTELGTNSWMETTLTRTAQVSGTLVFIYITFLMFILRFFAGPIVHRISPVGLLFFCSILSAVGLYALSLANNAVLAFAAATVFAVGITYYWPTMLGVTAERFPKGGALLLGLMGFVGNLSISQVTPLMGAVNDSYAYTALPDDRRGQVLSTDGLPKPYTSGSTGEALKEIPLTFTDAKNPVPTWIPPEAKEKLYPADNNKINPEARRFLGEVEKLDRTAKKEQKDLPPAERSLIDKDEPVIADVNKAEAAGASWAFRWTTVLPCVLIVIFGLIALVDKMRGGYRQVHLTPSPLEPRRSVHATPPGVWPRDQMR